MTRRTLCSVAAVLLFATACGTAQEPEHAENESSADPCRPVDVSLLRTSLYDYEPYLSLEALYFEGNQQVVVSGRISAFSDGPTVPVIADPQFPKRYVIMAVEVDGVLAGGSESLIADSTVYVPFEQGPVDGETGDPIYDVAAFSTALPKGTAVVMFLGRARQEVAEAAEAAIPAGATLGAVGVQDFYLDSCGELVGGVDDIPGSAGWAQFDHAWRASERAWSG